MGMIFLRNKVSGAVADAYAIGGASPELVAAFLTAADGTTEGEYFRTAGATDDFSMFTFSRASSAWYFNSSGVLTEATSGTARRNAYYHNGSAWAKGGLQLETAAVTQLLHGTDSFATQDETVTAQAYTLQFRGTGSITLTGAHSATLNGTGANDLVSLTFTPSAGTLTLTPSGTVDYPQLEVGSIPTSYIPNTAGSGTVTRAAEALTIAGADTPANTTAISISMKGLMTWAGESTYMWSLYKDGNNRFHQFRGGGGKPYLLTRVGGTNKLFLPTPTYAQGVNIPFNVAIRATGAGTSNAATSGTSGTAAASLGLPDFSTGTTLYLFEYFVSGFSPVYGFLSEFRMWGTDIGDSGIAEVTT